MSRSVRETKYDEEQRLPERPERDKDKGPNEVPLFVNDEEAQAYARKQQHKLYEQKVKDGTATEADRVAAHASGFREE